MVQLTLASPVQTTRRTTLPRAVAASLTLDVKDFKTGVVGHDGGELSELQWIDWSGEISCFSDGAGPEKGSCIYADTLAPNPPPTPSSTNHIVVSDGECDVVGYCVRCPNYPSDYGSNHACDSRFRSDGTLLVDDFAIENSLDYLLLASDTHIESTDPDDISVTSDSLLFWSSDYSTNHKGWLLCVE